MKTALLPLLASVLLLAGPAYAQLNDDVYNGKPLSKREQKADLQSRQAQERADMEAELDRMQGDATADTALASDQRSPAPQAAPAPQQGPSSQQPADGQLPNAALWFDDAKTERPYRAAPQGPAMAQWGAPASAHWVAPAPVPQRQVHINLGWWNPLRVFSPAPVYQAPVVAPTYYDSWGGGWNSGWGNCW